MPEANDDLKKLRLVFWILLLGQLFLAAIVFVIVDRSNPALSNKVMQRVFLIVTVIMSVFSVGFSYVLYRKRISEIKDNDSFEFKLQGFRGVIILQMAMSEGPALFTIISYLMTANIVFIGLFILLLVNFVNIYPRKSKLVQDLELNSMEESSLE